MCFAVGLEAEVSELVLVREPGQGCLVLKCGIDARPWAGQRGLCRGRLHCALWPEQPLL